jgi:hypothetical protein
MNQTATPILVALDDTRSIQFKSQEDVYIFYAVMGNYERLADGKPGALRKSCNPPG